MTQTLFLLVCNVCWQAENKMIGPPPIRAFALEDERRTWARDHMYVTGHDDWSVRTAEGTLKPT